MTNLVPTLLFDAFVVGASLALLGYAIWEARREGAWRRRDDG
jgi:hypothetical protein